MQKADKHEFQISNIIFLAGSIGLYLVTRLTGLMSFPVFSDEAMYIHIAQIIDNDRESLFLTKVNAFKPLFIWIIVAYQNILSDPILAARLVSVTAGVASLIGVYLLGRELFSERVGKVSAIIYLFCPYFIFYERLAFMESLVNAFGIWIALISFRISKENELKNRSFIFLGILLGLAFFTKSTALMFIPTPFVIFVLWKTYYKKNFFKFFSLTALIILLINLPYFFTDQIIGFQNRHPIFSGTKYYIPLGTLLEFPIEIWEENIRKIYIYLMIYLTFPLFLVTTFGMFYAGMIKNKAGIALTLLFAIPASIIMLIGNVIFSRYYLALVPPLILLSGWALIHLADYVAEKLFPLSSRRANIILSILLVFIVSEGMIFSKNLAQDPDKALFPNFDRFQYLISPHSGLGVKDAADYLISASRKSPIHVMTSWSQGNPQDGIMVYLWGKSGINIIPALWWPDQKQLFPQDKTYPVFPSKYQPISLRTAKTADLKNVFFIMPLLNANERNEFIKNNPDWKRVWSYPKYEGQNIDIFKLIR